MDNNKFGFEELDAWKKAREIKIEIGELVKTFPAEEKFRLIDQIIRSSRSVGNLIEKVMAGLLILIKSIFA